MEFDYKSVEVSIGTTYHNDEKMISYLTTKGTDMHRDSACDVWLLPPEEISSAIRQDIKSSWVFAQFYGSYYAVCAKAIWNNCLDRNTVSGIKLKDNLAEHGIETYEQFEEHCKKAEQIFWNERFPGYKQWKIDINNFYMKHGFIQLYTGFKCSGDLGRNDTTNHQIQGTAFHCLLYTIIKLNKKMKKLRSRLIGQVHDSGIIDLYPPEEELVKETIVQIGTKDILEDFSWINVPMGIDFECTPVNKSWNFKEKM